MRFKWFVIALFVVLTFGFILGFVNYSSKIDKMLAKEIVLVSADDFVTSPLDSNVNDYGENKEEEYEKRFIEIPALFGLTKGEAKESLEDIGFVPIIEEEYNSGFDQGIVYWQTPAAKIMAEVASEVKYSVSLGGNTESDQSENLIIVPNLIGFSMDEATSILIELGFNVDYEYNYSSNYDEGYVYSQNYKVDASVSKGTVVTIRISKGN